MPEIGKAHKTTHQDGGTDEISVAGLAGQLVFVPYNNKISDITHPDTNKHNLDLAVALGESRDVVSIIIKCFRMSGTGVFYTYPAEGSSFTGASTGSVIDMVLIATGTQRLQYSLSAANDDWDIYCLGYAVIGV